MAFSSDLRENSSVLLPPNDDEKLFLRRLSDAVKTVRQRGGAWYSAFLDSRQQQLAGAQVKRAQSQTVHAQFFGGFQGAERAMLCVFEDEGDVQFPIETVTIRPSAPNNLTHRDYLGALLALGVDRGGVGDICVGAQGAVVYMQSHLAALVRSELLSVGRHEVTTEIGAGLSTDAEAGETVRLNVPSLRLDAVLCAALSLSRADAKALVASGRVAVNHLAQSSPHRELSEGDLLSVRGVGRLALQSVLGQTRKNRINIEVIKY